MINKAEDLKTYLTIMADEAINKFHSMLKLNTEELIEYRNLLDELKRTNSSSTTSNASKGKALEDIVSFILNKAVVFEVYENVRTSTNEIDLLTRFNDRGNYFSKQGLLTFEPRFLCECKNYNQAVDVTWVGKFYSLIKTSKNSLGILFSYNGFSGRGWNFATGLTKKIYLSDEKNVKIIDFNISDFEEIAQGVSFIELINNKIFNLENDTKISFSEHPNNSKVESISK